MVHFPYTCTKYVIDLKDSSTTEDMNNVHFEEFSMYFAPIKKLSEMNKKSYVFQVLS